MTLNLSFWLWETSLQCVLEVLNHLNGQEYVFVIITERAGAILRSTILRPPPPLYNFSALFARWYNADLSYTTDSIVSRNRAFISN
jgi:hypothetical protein